ncbi:MAG: hypothetical protein KC516_01430 [Nanoarchaeota archaeon]|nr:hypothetical protein [Nanoarchaeota archaeon]
MAEVKKISDLIEEVSPYYKKKGKPEAQHVLGYDSGSETLEPIYFFILDLMNDFGLSPQKLVDNFSSSPGSGHFSELGGKKSAMQQQGSKLLMDINTVLRSILNIIYDLREFKIRLESYDDLKIPAKKDAAILSLKQLWMDKVDIEKGNSSIKAMALGQAGFATLIDAFLVAKTTKDVEKIDLNQRVKRILIPRINDFNAWLGQSESELRKRYEIERTYLRSQVNSLKLYSRWARPYLKAAQELEMKDQGRNPEMVKVFNTLLLELTLLGKRNLDIKGLSIEESFPKEFSKEKFLNNLKRNYHSCILVDFSYRGIPNKVQGTQHYSFGGKAQVTFKAYALNDDEIKMLEKKLGEDDVESALNLIDGITQESLDQLKEDLDYFLGDEEEAKEERPKDKSNPFLALFGFYNEKPKKETPKEKKEEKPFQVSPDNWYEKTFFRAKSAEDARETMFSIFDVYKKAHGMASFT